MQRRDARLPLLWQFFAGGAGKRVVAHLCGLPLSQGGNRGTRARPQNRSLGIPELFASSTGPKIRQVGIAVVRRRSFAVAQDASFCDCALYGKPTWRTSAEYRLSLRIESNH